MANNSGNEKKWHALYVRPRSEKKVANELIDMGFEVYLPVITVVRQWSDRRKKVVEPLFKSYLFVRSNEKEYYTVRSVFGVVKFVVFEGKVADVPDNQIAAIKKFVREYEGEDDLNVASTLKEGQMVRIITGGMKGLVGRLVSFNGKKRLLINIETVGQYIPVDIARSKVEPI